MKKTNTFPIILVKAFALALIFFVAGTSSAIAQSYKPLGEAAQAVQVKINELKQLPSLGPSTTITINYLELFIRKAKETQSVSDAVQELDAFFAGTTGQRADHINNSRNILMGLITG